MGLVRQFFLKPWLYIVIVILGTFLKFYQLDKKLFWQDEVSSVLYTLGVNPDIIQKQIPINQVKNYSFYDSLLHHNTKSYLLANQVTGIFSDTHLTPIHYVFLTLWYRLVGDNDIDYRLFSVFIFILTLPFIFLLAETLFNSYLAGWIAMSLFAVSPFIQLQAQEARYYILWVFFFVLSNYLFLQAIKQNQILWWISYSVASILALYTSLASCTFILGHVVYILILKKQLRIQFATSLLVIVLAYLPWVYFLYTVRETIEKGLSWHLLFHSSFFSLDLLFFQLLGFVRTFIILFNWNLYLSWFNGTIIPGIYSALLLDLVMLGFIIYAIYYLFTRNFKEISWFIALIILPLFLVLYLSDVIRGSFASVLWRYQVVNMVGISLIVTYLFKNKLANGNWLYLGIYIGIVSLSIASILKLKANPCSVARPDCASNIETAQLISQAANPLIITDFGGAGFFNFLAVLNESKAKNSDIMFCQGDIPNINELISNKSYSDVYVFETSDSLAQKVKSQFGERLLPYRKEVTRFSRQIWHIKL